MAVVKNQNKIVLDQRNPWLNFVTNLLKYYFHQEQASYLDMFSQIYTDRYRIVVDGKIVYLNKREMQCLAHLFFARTAKETARKLGISAKTVEYYINEIKIKINCRTRSQIVEIILDNNLTALLQYLAY